MSHNDKNMADRIFSIMELRFGTACGVNDPVLFLEIGKSIHKRFIDDFTRNVNILRDRHNYEQKLLHILCEMDQCC